MSLAVRSKRLDSATDGNHLIDSLPFEQRNRVLALCECIELDSGTVLCEAGAPFEYAYFPISGNISLVRTLPGHDPLEIENIGNEGMLGAVLILNINRSPDRGIVQTSCVALRIEAEKLQQLIEINTGLFRILQRYLYVVVAELSQTISCIHFHDVEKRLARGLLMAHDRDQNDELHLTHQLLAEMLGVQRGAITLAASKFQREGLIRYSRGKITILDRKKLEQSSCNCYGASTANYVSLIT